MGPLIYNETMSPELWVSYMLALFFYSLALVPTLYLTHDDNQDMGDERLAQWQLPQEVPGLDTVGLFAQQLEVAWPGCELPISSLSDQALIWQC